MNTINNLKTFQELNNHKVSEFTLFIINELKSEIYSKLPRLSDKEKIQREELINQKDSEEKFNIFYEIIRKKYTNFLELNYIPNDTLHELYDHLINYDEHKFYLKNRFFSYSLFLNKMIEKTVDDEFETDLENALKILKSNSLENYDGFWLNAMLKSDNLDKNVPSSINDLIKFNRDFSSTSILVTIELYYQNLEKDIYTLFINNLKTRRIIIKIEQKSQWIDELTPPFIYTNDEDWNVDMNRVINVILNCVNLMSDVQCLSILSDKNCNIQLDSINCELLFQILCRNKTKIEIFTLCRISLDLSLQNKIVDSILQLENVKFILFKSAKFKKDIFEIVKTFQLTNPDHFTNSFYLRFAKISIITNKLFEKIE